MSSEISHSSQMDELALAWATRIDGGLTSAEHDELNAWLAQDTAHEWRLAHYQHFFAQLHGTVPGLAAEGRIATPAADSAVTKSVRGARWRRAWAGGAFAAGVALGLFLFTQRADHFRTVAAQRQHVVLADGSHADLNARTVIEVKLRSRERRVRLEQGEAYFQVAKDPARPFFVETPAGTVRVTGTKFNVRTTSAKHLEVTVLEGSVGVATPVGAISRRQETGDAEFHLIHEDRVTVEGDVAAAQRLTVAAAENTIAWRDGKLVFDETPLVVALERFSDYHGKTVTVAPEVAGLPLGGRYTLDDFELFLGSLQKTLPVKVLRGENGAVRILANPDAR